MSAFARHGISHLSPSAINCWLGTPGLWTLRYLAKIKNDSGPAAFRGTAVEHGFEKLLRGASLEDAKAAALDQFTLLNEGELTDEIEAEAKLIPGMIRGCADWFLGNPVELAASQLKVETWLDGVSIPVIGYVDFCTMDRGDIDLKTTKACPSKPRPDHVRQVALYWKARERPASLLYVTEKRFAYFTPPESDLEAALNELTAAAQSLEHFLMLMPDTESAIMSMPMQRDHYTWSQAAESKIAEITGAA